jgi:hypothetical protein
MRASSALEGETAAENVYPMASMDDRTTHGGSRLDLRVQAPRPGHLSLGDWPWLPRMIDKARAKYYGDIGTYVHPCGRDQSLLRDLGLTAEEFKEVIETTETDDEVLQEVERRRTDKGF